MKSLFFFWLTVVLVIPSFAQSDRPEYNKDLSLSFSTVQAASQPFHSLVFNPRLMYRRHWGKLALRAQIEGMQYENRNLVDAYGFQKSLSATLGGQYTVVAGRFGCYGFLDFGYGNLELSKVETTPVTPFWGQYEKINGLKAQSGLGVDFRFAQRWRLGIESAATYVYGSATRTPDGVELRLANAIGPAPEERLVGKWIINPINAVWIGYAFGEKKN